MYDTMYCYSRNPLHSSKHATTILVGYLSIIIKFAFNILSDINNNKKSIKYSTRSVCLTKADGQVLPRSHVTEAEKNLKFNAIKTEQKNYRKKIVITLVSLHFNHGKKFEIIFCLQN